MKKTLSRILALLVALTVLLAPAALAEEYNTAVLSLGNFDITIDSEELFLPVTLVLLLGADPEAARGAATAQLRVDDLVAGMVSGAVEDDQLKVHSPAWTTASSPRWTTFSPTFSPSLSPK